MGSVLIVDDDPAERALFGSILTRAGYPVHEVASGGELPDRLEELRPDAVILGSNATGSDILSVCRRLRDDVRWTHLPVLMITSRTDDELVLAGLKAGVDDCVSRDAPGEVVLSRLSRLVQYRQMARLAALNEGLVQVGRLVAGIVHEIRGPISVIRGSAEILKMEHPGQADIDHRVDPIICACQLLQIRLEHLMTAVRSGPVSLVPLELAPLLDEVAELFRKGSSPRQKGVEIRREPVESLPLVQADPGRLMQVLLNLLANAHEAILAQKERGCVTLRAEPVEDADTSRPGVCLHVQDDGPGFPPGVADRVFEPFFTTKATGSGFGLYLAAEILREHKGRIWARNLDGGGACLSLWLPRGELPELPEQPG